MAKRLGLEVKRVGKIDNPPNPILFFSQPGSTLILFFRIWKTHPTLILNRLNPPNPNPVFTEKIKTHFDPVPEKGLPAFKKYRIIRNFEPKLRQNVEIGPKTAQYSQKRGKSAWKCIARRTFGGSNFNRVPSPTLFCQPAPTLFSRVTTHPTLILLLIDFRQPTRPQTNRIRVGGIWGRVNRIGFSPLS